MKMKIEVYQRRGGNIHVVLSGRATADGSGVDPDVFARYVAVWRAFAQAQVPQLILDGAAPHGGSWSRAVSTVAS
jgi:hypothetical protein